MEKTELQENIERIADHFGKESQVIVAIEEMSELMQALAKDSRGIGNMANIVEEIADVEIMLRQLTHLFSIQKEALEKEIRKKVARTLFRIEYGNKK